MIGCLSLARETFDIEFAKKKLAKTKRTIKKLNKNVNFFDDLITNDNIGENAIKYFQNSKCTKFIVIQSTFTDAKFISSFVAKFKKPILFVSFTEKRTGGRLRLNSLCGVNLGLHALIKNKYYSNFIIYSNDEQSFSKKISKFIKNKNQISKKNYLKKISNSKKINKKLIKFKQPKLGLIGQRPEGFDTCDFSSKELKTKFRAKIAKINLQNLFNISSKIDKKTINVTKKYISTNFKNLNQLNQKELNKSISLFHGLEKIQQKQNIDAFAVRCWPEMFTEYGCAACGPMAMMNENKISAACEADVLGSLSCNILNQFNNKPALLVDIVDVDEKDNTTVFWHCGLAPISMAEKNTLSATVHSNRRKPLLHNFAFKPGKITIFRVSKSKNELKFILMKGKVLKRKNSFSGTSGVISLGNNTYKKIKNLFLSGLEHHVSFTYGDVIEDIKSLGEQLKIPTYTI
jgi:L-fucose isomerase-like protein